MIIYPLSTIILIAISIAVYWSPYIVIVLFIKHMPHCKKGNRRRNYKHVFQINQVCYFISTTGSEIKNDFCCCLFLFCPINEKRRWWSRWWERHAEEIRIHINIVHIQHIHIEEEKKIENETVSRNRRKNLLVFFAHQASPNTQLQHNRTIEHIL